MKKKKKYRGDDTKYGVEGEILRGESFLFDLDESPGSWESRVPGVDPSSGVSCMFQFYVTPTKSLRFPFFSTSFLTSELINLNTPKEKSKETKSLTDIVSRVLTSFSDIQMFVVVDRERRSLPTEFYVSRM